jgi:hypothetical protein
MGATEPKFCAAAYGVGTLPTMAQDKDEGGMSANTTLALGLVVCAILVVVALLSSRFFKTEPPPPPVQAAPPAERSVNKTLRYTEGYFKALLDEDAKRYQLPTPTLDSIRAPLVYANELAAPRTLKAEKDQLDTPHLHITTNVSKEWAATGSAQRMRVEHMLMTITNKSARPIAYRIDTKPSNLAHCRSMGAMAQNAVALKPNETIQRSECLWAKGATLEVRAVEVIELTDLGYFYVSRLIPSHILLDERSAAGHEPAQKLKACSFVPWREIRTAADAKEHPVTWADVVDFYARHNCDEYTFFSTYRRWTTAGTLPAQAASEHEAPPPTPPAQPAPPAP